NRPHRGIGIIREGGNVIVTKPKIQGESLCDPPIVLEVRLKVLLPIVPVRKSSHKLPIEDFSGFREASNSAQEHVRQSIPGGERRIIVKREKSLRVIPTVGNNVIEAVVKEVGPELECVFASCPNKIVFESDSRIPVPIWISRVLGE